MKQIVAGVAAIMVVGCVTALRSYAGDEVQDARVQKGKSSYETYCTPCHGAGGAPGSAKFPGTKKPIDLRTYQQRNGGDFPSWRWWDVTFSPQPGAVHTEVWERIRNDQSEPEDGETDRSREYVRDILSRGVVVNIEMYVMSIQKKSK
jgi:mono/diheme cytochrome c family protein